MRRTFIVLVLMTLADLASARVVRCQNVRGTVRESATRQPIPGTVIIVLDPDGRTLNRNIADERGQYVVVASDAAAQLRFIRIGFRPLTVTLRRPAPAADTVDVSLTALATILDAVTVTAPACANRGDTGPALGLLEQARAGLLNSVVARDVNLGRVVRLRFQRTMDNGTRDRIVRQSVKLDSSARLESPFTAARSAAEFVREGFVRDEPSGRVFYAPDAVVLLDDAFLSGYCFRLVRPNRDHPAEVGLGFAAVKRATGRVDIDGVLWVDTTRRQLRTLEFRYVGLDPSIAPANPAGRISFREMANGVIIIDRWSLRLPAVRVDSVYDSHGRAVLRQTRLEVQETGGEVAHIEWPSGLAWDAPLGTLRVAALTYAHQPAAGTHVWLEHTDYTGRTDANGEVTLAHLLPGPYQLVIVDSLLEPLGITLRTPVEFDAARDSTIHARLDVPTAEDYVAARCKRDGIWNDFVPRHLPDAAWMIGRVVGSDDKPVNGVWAVVHDGSSLRQQERVGVASQATGSQTSSRAGTDGIFELCQGIFRIGDTVTVAIYHNDLVTNSFRFALKDSVTIMPLIREPKAP